MNRIKVMFVDFQNNPEAEELSIAALQHTGAEMLDWFEKDYGVKILVEVDEDQEKKLMRMLTNIPGICWEGRFDN